MSRSDLQAKQEKFIQTGLACAKPNNKSIGHDWSDLAAEAAAELSYSGNKSWRFH